jgi:hypothetical protein
MNKGKGREMKNVLGKYKEVREQVQSSAKDKVLDPHHFNADPDPAFHFNEDPDPNFHFDADPDLAPHHSGSNLRPLVNRPPKAPF